MKKATILFIFFAVVLFAAWPNFTYDVAQTFESSLSGAWSEFDTTSILTPQSTTQKYRGTYALEVAAGSAAEAYANLALSPAKSSVSVGFWYRSGSYAGWAGEKYILWAYNSGQGTVGVVKEGRSAGDNSRRMLTSLNTTAITIADSTWYWVTYKHVQNGTCSLSVYDTSGTQVGSTITGTSTNYSVDELHFGSYSTSSSVATYIDEIYVDYADATFPLGPPTEDAAGRRRVTIVQ